jgi:hypothetical protein
MANNSVSNNERSALQISELVNKPNKGDQVFKTTQENEIYEETDKICSSKEEPKQYSKEERLEKLKQEIRDKYLKDLFKKPFKPGYVELPNYQQGYNIFYWEKHSIYNMKK